MGSQSQSQKEEEEKTRRTMKKRPFAEIDGGEPSPTSAAATAVAYTDLDLGRRVSKLEKMVRVLKSMHSSLRRDYWTSPPTCDEIRMYHLILVHVNSYISLFHIERSSSHRALPLFPKPKQGEEEEEEEDEYEEELAEALDEKVGVLYIYPGLLASTLVDGRNASLKPEQDPLFRNLPLMKAMVEDNTRNPESKQKLMRILSDLEEMGRARGYAPPLEGREIECYREIRNWMLFSIVFVYSNVDLHVGTKATPRCRPPKLPHAPYDRFIHAPLGHGLAAGYEMIPVHQSFFDICRRHLSTIEEGDVDDPSNNDVSVEGEIDISNAGVEVKDNGGGGGRRPVMKSRLECLQIIVSEFIRVASSRCSPNLPTKEEVRLYAQIAEHVYSSTWLFDNSEDIQTEATGCHELIDVTDAFYNSPDDTGPLLYLLPPVCLQAAFERLLLSVRCL